MNLRIPIPRIPARVTAILDAYSAWAELPAGPMLGHYQMLRRDWISIAIIITVSAAYMAWTDSWIGFMLGIGAGIAAWIWYEATMWQAKL